MSDVKVPHLRVVPPPDDAVEAPPGADTATATSAAGVHAPPPPPVENRVSRTDKLLKQLGVDEDFKDESLPTGTFSHSQYTSWLICGKAYEFRYVLNMPSPSRPAMVRGSAVHSGVEDALRDKLAGKTPNLVKAQNAAMTKLLEISNEAAGVTWGEEEDGETERQTTQDTEKLVDTFFKLALPKINPIAVEKGFARKVGTVPMVGYIDVIDEQPDVGDAAIVTPEMVALAPKKRVIVDLKTSAKTWSEDAVAKSPQLTLYTLVELTPYARVDQLLLQKKGPAYVSKPTMRSADDMEVYVQHLNEVAHMVRQGTFPAAPIDHWSCSKKHCPYWNVCRGKKK